jgi:DNA-binding beta-propeller fold protein YncE
MRLRALAGLGAVLLCAQDSPLRPGPLTDGTTLLPTGWRIKPAGTQVPVGPFPAGSALSPDGTFLLVVNTGAAPSVSVIRTADQNETARVPVPDAWQGIAFSTNGRNVYVSGGARNSVYEFTISAEGALTLGKEMPAGSGAPGPDDFIGDIAIPPAGRLIYAADLFHDRILVINPQSGAVIDRFRSGRRPFQILFHPDGNSYFVSSWADASVYQYQTDTGADMGRMRVAPHPTGMAISDFLPAGSPEGLRYRLFVATAASNAVHVIGVDESKLLRALDVLSIGFAAVQPAGMTPSALALSPDERRLFIACSDVNAVAVADISEDRSRLAGFVPAGAYPTALHLLPDNRLAIVNGRGAAGEDSAGSVSILPLPDETALARLTDEALALVAYRGDAGSEAGIPAAIENVVYILDESGGRGPNHEKLAREFAAVHNYVPNTAPGADAFYWLVAGMPSEFTQRLSPSQAAGRLRRDVFEGGEPANLPPAGYLWSNAVAARVAVRNFGIFTDFTGASPRVKDPSLQAFTNLAAPAERTEAFLAELAGYEAQGAMPRLVLLRHSADDAALGRIVEAISKSRFWPRTAIFIAGSSAPALVVSPFSRGVQMPATELYNQSSILRTVEMILKLRPMTLFDAAARPVTGAFTAAP